MKLEKKKDLAARTLNVGKSRIVFNTERLSEIKEAITKQDIQELHRSGAILIREKKGRRRNKKRKTRRRPGSVKKKVKTGKREYVILTRKLRAHLKSLKAREKISEENMKKLRKEIRTRSLRNLAHMKEQIKQFKEEE